MKRHFKRPYLNIVGHRYLWFAISGAVVIVAVISLFTMGLNWGIDFTGGTEFDVRMKSGITIAEVRSATGKLGYGTAQIQSSGKDTFIIRVPKLDDAKKAALVEGLKANAGLQEVQGVNDVGPGWGGQVSRQAIIAVIVFLLAILLYISVRFEFKMAITAIIEVFHDLAITVGVYALLGRVVTPATVIAVLTILGYSLYDSIVIFDRIKENADQLTRQSKKTYSEMVNDSVNQVLVRSINTSLTTLIPIVCLLFFGGETLKDFAFALFIGVLSGTYSSIILGPPVLATWKETEPKYRAFRQRSEVRQGRQARVAATDAPQPKPKPAPKPQQKAARAARPTPAQPKPRAAAPKPKPLPKEEVAREEDAGEEGLPKPKPKPRPVAKQQAPTSKAQAKSRTKGPGSGKKKKKKR